MEEILDQDERADDGDGLGLLFRDDFGGSRCGPHDHEHLPFGCGKIRVRYV